MILAQLEDSSSEVNEGNRTSSIVALLSCQTWIRLGSQGSHTHYLLLEVERNTKTMI